MPLDGTYSGLQASVADFLNRNDLTAAIPDFIAMAEVQMSRRMVKEGPVSGMLGRSDATINAEFISTPADFMGVKAFYLGAVYYPLQFMEPEKIVQQKMLYPLAAGDPQFYSVVGGQFQFWPWPGTSATYSAELSYWKRVPALSTSNTTNWLLQANPDAYLYGALTQSAPYLADDERTAVWGALYTAAVSDIIDADKMTRYAPQMASPQIIGGVNDGGRYGYGGI